MDSFDLFVATPTPLSDKGDNSSSTNLDFYFDLADIAALQAPFVPQAAAAAQVVPTAEDMDTTTPCYGMPLSDIMTDFGGAQMYDGHQDAFLLDSSNVDDDLEDEEEDMERAYQSDDASNSSLDQDSSSPESTYSSTSSSSNYVPEQKAAVSSTRKKTPSKKAAAAAADAAGGATATRPLPKHPQAPTTQMTEQLNKMLKLDLSEEELVEMDLAEIQELSGVRLTKLEERQIRQLRRKLKNKMAAASSREKKRNYVDGLEERVELVTRENMELRETVESLRRENESLRAQLQLQQQGDLPRKMPKLAAEPAATAAAATTNSRPIRVTKAHAVSAFVVVLMLFGAVANQNILPSLSVLRSSGSISPGSDNNADILSGPAAFWAGSSSSSPSFSTGRKLLVTDACSPPTALTDDEDSDIVNSFINCDALHHDDEPVQPSSSSSSSWSSLLDRLLAAVSLHNDAHPSHPAELVA